MLWGCLSQVSSWHSQPSNWNLRIAEFLHHLFSVFCSLVHCRTSLKRFFAKIKRSRVRPRFYDFRLEDFPIMFEIQRTHRTQWRLWSNSMSNVITRDGNEESPVLTIGEIYLSSRSNVKQACGPWFYLGFSFLFGWKIFLLCSKFSAPSMERNDVSDLIASQMWSRGMEMRESPCWQSARSICRRGQMWNPLLPRIRRWNCEIITGLVGQ